MPTPHRTPVKNRGKSTRHVPHVHHSPKPHGSFLVPSLVLACLLLILIGFGGWNMIKRSSQHRTYPVAHEQPIPHPTNRDISPLPTIPTEIPPEDTTIHSLTHPLFSGTMERLSQDLGLMPISNDEVEFAKTNKMPLDIKTYAAGTFTEGIYAGYTRVIAVKPSLIQMGQYNDARMFATKDFKTFILDSTYGDGDVERTKIQKIASLPTNHYQFIDIGNGFALSRNTFLQSWLGDTSFTLDQSRMTKLNFPNAAGISIYKAIPSENPLYSEATAKEKEVYTIKQQYVDGTTDVIVVDSTGLPMHYGITRPSTIYTYLEEKKKDDAYQAAVKKHNELRATHPETTLPDFPTHDAYARTPNLRIPASRVKSTVPLYSIYDVGLPAACGRDANTPVLKNISDHDLIEIANTESKPLYTLADRNHPLNKIAYYEKIEKLVDVGHDFFAQVNENKKIPTFEEYVSRNPLLITKDFWNRYVLLQEWEYQLGGGCGKPVIYLYPPTKTPVSIRFTQPMDIQTQIPAYHDGWYVEANPDGNITDLQPQFTDCSMLPITHQGAEYAKQACETNSYPYIYWTGNSLQQKYPDSTRGWIVSSYDVERFLNQKLDEVGLLPNEKSEMLAYWLPRILGSHAPHYRIAFLQTEEMNRLAPMQINPTPNRLYRIFIDWFPLATRPTAVLEPQVLQKIQRQGFTVVEWGGLLR